MDGVLGIAVAEVVLDQTQVVALVGEVVAAGVPERVWVDVRQTGAPGGEADKVANGLPGKRLAALRQEQPGQVAPAHGEVAPDRTQLVADNGLLHGQPALE